MENWITKIEAAFRFCQILLKKIIGAWQPPTWSMPITSRWAKTYDKNRMLIWKVGSATVAASALGYGGYLYYESLPKPEACEFKLSYQPNPEWPGSTAERPQSLSLRFSCSAARAETLDKALTSDQVTISPEIKGEWRWSSASTLSFQPEGPMPSADWVRGRKHVIKIKKAVVASHVRMKNWDIEFEVPGFEITSKESEFYIDPRDESNKRARMTVHFNSPVDVESLKTRVSAEYVHVEKPLQSQKDKIEVQVRFNNFNNEAYILTDPLPTPKLSGEVFLRLDEGVAPVIGGPKLKASEARVTVPARKGSFHIESAAVVMAPNENFEPVPTLLIRTNLGIDADQVAKKIKVSLLPRNAPQQPEAERKKPFEWSSAGEVSDAVRRLLKPVQIKPNPSVELQPKIHSFRLSVRPKDFVFVELPGDLMAFGGYELDANYAAVSQVPEIPKEITIMGDGMLLSLSGEKKLSILSRGIGSTRLEIARVLPERAGLMFDELSNSNLKAASSYDHLIDRTSTRIEEKIQLGNPESSKANFYALDLGKAMVGSEKLGLFYIRLRSNDYNAGAERVVLLTDLGVVGKKTVKGSFDIFVQSLQNGDPVAGATVEAIGKNGEPVFSSQTDQGGHAEMPDISTLRREKEVVFFLVRKGNDISFLYPNKSEQRLNFSRFDVAGQQETSDSDALTTMIFSERGLYRPGDDIHFGLVTRSKNIKKAFADVSVNWAFSDPGGTEIAKGVAKVAAGSLSELKLKTSENSIVGRYTLVVYIEKNNFEREVLGTQSVRVEEFQADRMRNQTALSKSEAEGWVSPIDLKARVSLKNLFGTPAVDRRVSGRVVVAPHIPYFPSFKDWQFTNINPNNETVVEETLSDLTTSETGAAEWTLPLSKFAGGMYRVSVYSDGFEASGGRSVAGAATSLMSPLPFLVGVKSMMDRGFIKAGAPHEIEIIGVSPQAKAMAVSGLKVDLVESRYVSVLQERADGTYAYQSTLKEEVLKTDSIDLSEKGKKISLKTDVPGEYTLVFRNSSGQELNRFIYSVAGERNLSKRLDRNSELKVVLDRSDYEKGGRIEMQVRAPYAGAGLITIERDQVYAYKWFKSATTNTVQTIDIPEGLEGNAYVTVTYLRDRQSVEVFTNPLSFATAPFSISLKSFQTKIDLEAPTRVKPGDKLAVKYKSSRPASLVIYGVDEGILQVARYRLPSPLDFFFKKRALQVETLQILDLVLPEYSLLRSAPGGDGGFGAIAKNLNPFKRKGQPPVVFWSGVLSSSPTVKTFEYSVPAYYNGNLKIMAVASSREGMGSSELDALVRGDIVITPTAPLFSTPGDEFELHVSLANQIEGSGKQSKLEIEVADTAGFSLLDDKKKTLTVDEGFEGSTTFRVKTLDHLGATPIKLTARGGSATAKLDLDIAIRPATPYRTLVQASIAKALPVELDAKQDHYNEFRKKIFSVAIGPVALSSALKSYLDQYPYGCTEQMLSRAFPGLLTKTRSILNLKKSDEEVYFTKALELLRSRQTADGGFGLYSGRESANHFISLYALFYITIAKEQGYAVPQDLLDRAVAYAQMVPLDEGSSTELVRYGAFAQYLLARNGKSPRTDLQGFVARYRKAKPDGQKDIAIALIAATYKILKLDAEALRLIKAVPPSTESSETQSPYYDTLVHGGLYFYLVAKHFTAEQKSLVTLAELEKIVAPVSKGLFHSLSAAQLLLAFEALYESGDNGLGFTNLVIQETTPKGEISRPLNERAFARLDVGFDATKVKATGTSAMPVYYSLLESGYERALPKAVEQNRLEVSHSYLKNGAPIRVVQQGDEIEVRIRARSLDGKIVPNVALVDLYPAGFEQILIEEPGSPSEGTGRTDDSGQDYQEEGSDDHEGESESETAPVDEEVKVFSPLLNAAHAQATTVSPMLVANIDQREDRVILYATVTGELTEFAYRLKAVSIGKFVIPPAFGEGMYDRQVFYRGVADHIEVRAK